MPTIAPESLVLLTYMLVGGVLVLLGLPLYFHKIPPNRFYGFRTVSTLGNPEVWYPVNRVTGGWMVVTGAVTAGVATWAQRAGYNVPFAAMVNLITFSVGMLLMLIHSVVTLWNIK